MLRLTKPRQGCDKDFEEIPTRLHRLGKLKNEYDMHPWRKWDTHGV